MTAINTAYTNSSATTTSTSTKTSASDKSLLGSEDFLKLLTIQLSNQDPFEPMSDTEFISQMANFSSLEQMSTLSTNFTNFSARQHQLSSQAYLGRQVTLNSSGSEVSGIVTEVSTGSDGGIYLTIDGTQYDSTTVTKVSLPASSTE